MLDWVLHSQFLGKLQNLGYTDNTLFENINRLFENINRLFENINLLFERDGIIIEEALGVPTNLDERQANDLQDWFCLMRIPAFSDIIYDLNNYVFVNNVQSLGK